MSASAVPEPQAEPAAAPTRVRFKILAWLCSLSALTYLDRICIAQLQGDIRRDLGLTPVLMGFVFSAFSLAYALFEVPSGWLGDRIGPRKVLSRIVLCWSAFTALTGSAWNMASLWVFRFLFGAGEAGAYPNMARATKNWFPFRERGYAQGMVWMFARWGGAAAPLIVMVLAYPFGWRGAFLLLGVIGVAWVWAFRRSFHDTPAEDGRPNAAELAYIAAGGQSGAAPAALSWPSMLRSPTLWCLSIMYFCSNAGWSFFATWLTAYLKEDLGLSGFTQVIASAGPLFFGGIACLLGGFLTDRQVQVWGRRWGRTLQGVIAYGLGGLCFLAAVAATPTHPVLAYVAICLASFVKDFGLAASWATTIDIGHRYSGTVAGFMNSIGNSAQFFTPPIVAALVVWAGRAGQTSWKISLYYYGAMFLVASVMWLFVNPRHVIVYSPADAERLRAEGKLD